MGGIEFMIPLTMVVGDTLHIGNKVYYCLIGCVVETDYPRLTLSTGPNVCELLDVTGIKEVHGTCAEEVKIRGYYQRCLDATGKTVRYHNPYSMLMIFNDNTYIYQTPGYYVLQDRTLQIGELLEADDEVSNEERKQIIQSRKDIENYRQDLETKATQQIELKTLNELAKKYNIGLEL